MALGAAAASGCPIARRLPGLWRIRIGDYRVVYAIKDVEFVVSRCASPPQRRLPDL